jgi:tetratricopeptide (TPR) repeat protein
MDIKQRLLHELCSPRAEVRNLATEKLWQLWFGEAGPEAELELAHAVNLMNIGAAEECEATLGELIKRYPTFTEAWNRRATLRYTGKQYESSLSDCYEVVRLEPHHFGAWHGMGLCLMALHRYADAANAFRHALAIQPFAQINQELLVTCLAKLN